MERVKIYQIYLLLLGGTLRFIERLLQRDRIPMVNRRCGGTQRKYSSLCVIKAINYPHLHHLTECTQYIERSLCSSSVSAPDK